MKHNKTNPTTDIYFLHSCQQFVARMFSWFKPVKRLGANSFECGNRILVLRDETSHVLDGVYDKVQSKGFELLYLIDDNIWEIEADTSLSASYRKKLIDFREKKAKKLIDLSNRVFVSSSFLLPFIPAGKQAEVVRPVWPSEPPVGRHFDYSTEYFNLVHMGTNSHRAGFGFIVPVIERLIEKYDHVHFTYYSNNEQLGELDKHPRVHRKGLLRWWFYHRYIGKNHYHLALYPIMPTPINQGRSFNKILEHPLFGCGAIYSSDWVQSDKVQAFDSDMCISNDADLWFEKICELIEDIDLAKSHYHKAMKGYFDLNSLTDQRDFWRQHFIQMD